MQNFKFGGQGLRILDFDIENRPLTYLGSDYTTSDITAIAWAWTDEPKTIYCLALDEHTTQFDILDQFLAFYDRADVVTGHYILGHDLPIINGALLEHSLEPLGEKLVSDTKVHLVGRKGVSASQESLGGMLGLSAPKVHMDQTKWRLANRLDPRGIEDTRRRVVGDVKQHMQLRRKLIELGWLGPPKPWSHGQRGAGRYTP